MSALDEIVQERTRRDYNDRDVDVCIFCQNDILDEGHSPACPQHKAELELASLRSALAEARKVIEPLAKIYDTCATGYSHFTDDLPVTINFREVRAAHNWMHHYPEAQ